MIQRWWDDEAGCIVEACCCRCHWEVHQGHGRSSRPASGLSGGVTRRVVEICIPEETVIACDRCAGGHATTCRHVYHQPPR